jgi:hypothetical protein
MIVYISLYKSYVRDALAFQNALNKVENGMTYEEISKMLGSKGRSLYFHSGGKETDVECYSWGNTRYEKMFRPCVELQGLFKDGVLQKYQIRANFTNI